MKKDSQQAVSAWMGETAKLKDTAMTIEVLYQSIMNRDKKAPAYLYFDEDNKPKTVSYGEWDEQCQKAAAQLASLAKYEEGSIVGIKIKNSPKWPILYWAIVMNGYVPLLIDARLAKENTDNLLRQSGAKGLIANDEETFVVPSFRANQILSHVKKKDFKPHFSNQMIFCSSGTTGDAKMMIYEGKNLCAQVLASLNIPEKTVDLMYPSQIRCLAMLPFHHVFGFMVNFLWYTYYGKTLVYPNSLATSDLLHACKVGKCTHIYSVPLFWDGIATAVTRLVSQMKSSRQDLFTKMVAFHTKRITKKEAGFASSNLVLHIFQKKLLGTQVRYCISGGGFLSPKTQELINGLGYPLYNGFGMTEVGITSVEQSPRVEQRLKGSIGKTFAGITYKLDESKGEKVEGSTFPSGELMVSSPIIHVEEIIGGVRKKVQLEDGFFRTGDIATVDAQGSYYLKGRIKDTIILSNGENVFPDEIEYYFKNLQNVKNVACLGAKKPGEKEESITLVVETDGNLNKEATEKLYGDIKAINDTLPSEKKVQWTLLTPKPLPMSGSMKVKRFVLKEAIESGNSEYSNQEAPKKVQVSFDGYNKEEVIDAVSRVTRVFSSVLLLPEEKIAPDAVWNTDLGGDSMSYIEMCQALDKEFSVSIPEEVYGTIGTVNDFAKLMLDLKKGK